MKPPFSQLHLEPLTISVYGLLIALAVFLGYQLAKRRAPLYTIKSQVLDDLLLPLIACSIIGARLYHVIDQWSYYQNHLPQILFIWQGGIGIYGALAGGLIALYWFCKKNNVTFLSLADLITPSLLLGQSIGRWGNFFNQEAFGPPTNLPWKIYIAPTHRPAQWFLESYFHPLFLYESLWNLAGFAIALYISKKLVSQKGALLGFYFVWYGIGRIIIEQLRFDTAVLLGIKFAVTLSILCIVIGLALIVRVIVRKID